MAAKKEKKRTEYNLRCNECGALASVFALGNSRWFSHCPGCGKMWFGSNPDLLERLKYSEAVCLHNPPRKPCKGGYTTWCPLCRIRTFSYVSEESRDAL